MNTRDMFETIGALEKGVVLPTCDIKIQLDKMSEKDARVAKRKWRKIVRKSKKDMLGQPDKKTLIRFSREILREAGRTVLTKAW